MNTVAEQTATGPTEVARISPRFLSLQSDLAARCRALTTVLAARWETAAGSESRIFHPRSCLIAGVNVDTAPVGLRLAVAFAQAGRPTTLFDVTETGDGAEAVIAFPVASGSTNGWDDGQHAPVFYPTSIPNLTVVQANASDAPGGDLKLADRVAALLERLDGHDSGVAIVAAPALTVGPSALSLARLASGVLLAVTPGRTTRSDAARARDALQAAGGRIWGVILASEERCGR